MPGRGISQECQICAMSRHRNVINTKRSGHCAFHDGPQDVNFVEIAQPWVRMKPVPNGWTDDTMPEKMADPGRPVISISIRQHHFDGLICDTGSSVYIIPKVIYSSVLDFGLLLPSNIRLRFTNQTIRQVEGIVGLRMSRQFIRPDRFCGIGYRIRHKSSYHLGTPFSAHRQCHHLCSDSRNLFWLGHCWTLPLSAS
jgi:hypothetical protein